MCEPARHPLIPTRHNDELGVSLQRVSPLLVEIEAEIHRIRPFIFVTLMPAPAHGSGSVAHWRRTRCVRQGILSHTDAHLFRLTLAVPEQMLWINFQPAP